MNGEVINRSINCSEIAELFVNDNIYIIKALPSEMNLELRVSWIYDNLRLNSERSVEETIKLSVYWFNFKKFGCKYSIINEEMYNKWSEDHK